MNRPQRICIVPGYRGVGGPASFRMRFSQALAAQGVQVCDDLDETPYDAILVISGTRQLGKLRRAIRQGIPVVQRLDGINWMHRKTRFNLRYYLKAEYGNLLLNYTRMRLASRIIYQSQFVARRWEQVYGRAPVPHDVIYNSVDLAAFSPNGPSERPAERSRIMLVEGSYTSGHDVGLGFALEMARLLESEHHLPVELMAAGRASPEIRARWDARATVPLTWAGIVERERIPFLDRSAQVYFSAEVNAPCPNSVIEALACGLPVVAFDTGSLPELVQGDAGRIAPYGADPWQLDKPDLPALAAAAAEVLTQQERFRAGARRWAEQTFNITEMVTRYMEAISQA